MNHLHEKEYQLHFVKLLCALIILSELKKKTITKEYDKLSFRNVLN